MNLHSQKLTLDYPVSIVPMGTIAGYQVRPGLFDTNGAIASEVGVNFTVHTQNGHSCELLLFHKGEEEPYAILPFPDEYKVGDVYSMIVFGLKIEEFEYAYRIDGEYQPDKGLLFNKDAILLDPYARAVTGQEIWGEKMVKHYHARVVKDVFDWGDMPQSSTQLCDLVIYEMHVRGFTYHPSSGVKFPGTFAGIREKIPYLRDLGITQLELMPVYEFAEYEEAKASKKHMPVRRMDTDRINYWGYGDACFFAPKASYSASGDPVRELKELVRELHRNGLELILEFYFPERTSPYLIRDCICYWVSEYHIDGVHVNCRGTLLEDLALDPRLSGIKIMSEYFPLEQIYEPGYEPAYRRLAEYNDGFLERARRFLRGDEDMLGQVAYDMRRNPPLQAVVNYMAYHNGFTLMDAVSYDVKHNEANGEEDRDGTACNYSCNYGEEGPAAGRKLKKLRRRQLRNAFLLILLSQGVPAIYGGDEMGNSQQGNNNVWCQDNETAWIQWSRTKADRDLRNFVREAIRYRKESPVFGRRREYEGKDRLSRGCRTCPIMGKKHGMESLRITAGRWGFSMRAVIQGRIPVMWCTICT